MSQQQQQQEVKGKEEGKEEINSNYENFLNQLNQPFETSTINSKMNNEILFNIPETNFIKPITQSFESLNQNSNFSLLNPILPYLNEVEFITESEYPFLPFIIQLNEEQKDLPNKDNFLKLISDINLKFNKENDEQNHINKLNERFKIQIKSLEEFLNEMNRYEGDSLDNFILKLKEIQIKVNNLSNVYYLNELNSSYNFYFITFMDYKNKALVGLVSIGVYS